MNEQQRAAMQMALEALEGFEITVGQRYTNLGQTWLDAIIALREALAQPQENTARCGGCSKTAKDGWALYCVECWEKAEPVKQEEAKLPVEPVATYMGHRLTPEGTKEFWGYADTVLPEKTKLYAEPVDAKAIRAEALEEAAKVCEEPSYMQQRAKTSAECAAAIRSMK
jgi:hypothetical protein